MKLLKCQYSFCVFLFINGINVLPVIIMVSFAYMMFKIMDIKSFTKNPSKIITTGQGITFDQIGASSSQK